MLDAHRRVDVLVNNAGRVHAALNDAKQGLAAWESVGRATDFD